LPRKALVLDAKANTLTSYLAYALGKDGRSNEALSSFDNALSLTPFEPTIYLRAEIFEQNKMFQRGIFGLQKGL
jgi:hypothetical protein